LTSILLLAGIFVLAGCGGSSATPVPTGTPVPTVQGTPVSRPSDQVGNNSGVAIGRIACDATATHSGGVAAKATLTITVDKTSFRPSSNLGVLKSCTYWIHTDATGNLVFDAPAGSALPTLMEFFSVIRNANGTDPYIDQFAMYVTSGTITVNGKADTDPWGNIVIHDGDQIVVTAKPAAPATSQPSATAPASTSSSSPAA
jgi:hypothetical protein